MESKTLQVKQQFTQALATLETMEELEKIRVEYIGKKGFVTDLLKEMKSRSGG